MCWGKKYAVQGGGRLTKHISNALEYVKELEKIVMCVYEQN